MLNVFLDDLRKPINAYNETGDEIYLKEKWHLVKDYEEFCSYTKSIFKEMGKLPEIFSFDHNLAPEHYVSEFINYDSFTEKTGYHCSLYLKNFCDREKISYPLILSHSASPQGRKNILKVFYQD
ncbi:MAG: cyclic-phosphate processing receiver domain-containing protein [Cyanobacteriota bacterium]